MSQRAIMMGCIEEELSGGGGPELPITENLFFNLDARSGLYQDISGATPATSTGATVDRWNDISGNGFDFTRTDTGCLLDITSGIPGVKFDGVTTTTIGARLVHNFTNEIKTYVPHTLYFVFKDYNPADTSIFRYLVDARSDRHIFGKYVSTGNLSYYNGGGWYQSYPSSPDRTAICRTTTNSPFTKKFGETKIVSLEGAVLRRVLSTVAIGNYNGLNGNLTSATWDGLIHHVLWYSGVSHTEAQADEILFYLSQVWDL